MGFMIGYSSIDIRYCFVRACMLMKDFANKKFIKIPFLVNDVQEHKQNIIVTPKRHFSTISFYASY